MLKLQNVLLPAREKQCPRDMYYRVDDLPVSDVDGAGLLFKQGAQASFDTYFNCFSIGKWKKYTQVKSVSLSLTLQGSFDIRLLGISKSDAGAPQFQEYAASRLDSDIPQTFVLPFPESADQPFYTFRLRAARDDSRFINGWYGTELDESALSPVNIGVSICTFRREAFVERNIGIIKKAFLCNADCELSRHLQLFIADNGKTLDVPSLSDECIHIFPNKNTGGAGGFTRGLIEILHADGFRATHALLMDDDILIEPEALWRTYMLLRCLKEAYRDAFVGGAMLRLDRPNIQTEAGARWNEGRILSYKAGADMNDLGSVIENETEEEYEYNAWWYCCIPMSVINSRNLPLPIFIRGDDLEYGLRAMKRLILLNGICVWHEPFESKYSSWLNYYFMRNMLYDNSLRVPGYGRRRAVSAIWKQCLLEMLYYRYLNVDLMLSGGNDFLKGSAFLKETDAEALHLSIIRKGYPFKPVQQLDFPFSAQEYARNMRTADKNPRSMFRLSGFNGLLYPANHDTVVPVAQCNPAHFYRVKKALHYDEAGQKGFVTEKSLAKTALYACKVFHTTARLLIKYNRVRRDLLENEQSLINEEFWRSYLGIGAR